MKFCPSCGARYENAARFCQHDGTLLRAAGGAAEEDPYVGQVLLGQFEIQEVIGEGGMGRVYRAHQHGFDRPVAIKILHTDLVTNQEMVKRFNREAKIISRLDHPSIPHVYLFGALPDGNLYLAMEYVDGVSLTKLIKGGPIPVEQTVHIGRQILSALTEAHRKGVVHRDLKPDNIMLVARPDNPTSVKVLDFGIAKFLGSRTMLTQQGLVFGSARYISPEAAAGEEIDERADLYAIGVILYQMFAGKPPFDDASAVSLLMRHVNDPPPPLFGHPGAQNVPKALAQVIMQALEKDPARRFDDAAAMRTALSEAARAARIKLAGVGEDALHGWSDKSGEPPDPGSQTDPMFSGAAAAGQTSTASSPTTQERSTTRKSVEPTAPQTPSRAKAPPAAKPSPKKQEPTPAAVSSKGEAAATERESDRPSPNDDTIQIPRSRAWPVVLLVLGILALAGGAMGALLALNDTEPQPDADTEVTVSVPQPVPAEPPEKVVPEPATTAPDAGTKSVPVAAPVAGKAPRGTAKRTPEPGPTAAVATPDAGAPTKLPTKVLAQEDPATEDDDAMPPSATLSLQPRRPQSGQKVRIVAKIDPATTLSSPRFIIKGGGASKSAKATLAGDTYVATHTFDKAGSYQVTFLGSSNNGEVRAFSDAVVKARPRTKKRTIPSLRDIPTVIAPPGTDDKPPEGQPRTLEPWNSPQPPPSPW